MIVILFRFELTAAAGEDYAAMQARMEELAVAAPGFVAQKSFLAEDGERLTLIWWKDLETLRLWREDPRHRVAQEAGRRLWYEYYDGEVAEVLRRSHFFRGEESAAAPDPPAN